MKVFHFIKYTPRTVNTVGKPLILCTCLAVVFLFLNGNTIETIQKTREIEGYNLLDFVRDIDLPEEVLRYDNNLALNGFNNETGVNHFVVPNIIHLIRYNKKEWSLIDYVCIQSAFRNHRPDSIYIHTNVPNGEFEGKYWNMIRQNASLYSIIKVLHLDLPSHIFGQKLNENWRLWHGSDVARLRVIMKYGGIYLDNDVYVINSLDKYRKFEAVVNWDEGVDVGNNLIIANRNARVLPLWLDTYRDYHSDLWYHNGGSLPTSQVLTPHPELVHRVKVFLGFDTDLTMRLYWDKKFRWRKLDAIHLNINHRYWDPTSYDEYPVLDEQVLKTYPYPFGDMVREMLNL